MGGAVLMMAVPMLAGGVPAGADTSSSGLNYTAAAQAPVMQVTQDDPTAQFHPQGEGDYDYTFASASNAGGNALASVLWPGSAAGNAGTLLGLLGVPGDLSALNYPVRAAANSGGPTSDSVTTPAGTAMTASASPASTPAQNFSATSSLAGGGLGSAGTVSGSQSSSNISLDPGTGVITAKASSTAHNIEISGVVAIGSVTSSAAAVSKGGAAPQLSGTTVFSGFTVGGSPAYVDATGVHTGTPGHPADSVEQQAVDSALNSAGMEIFFTSPHTITVGQTAYYYAGSVVFFWAPPGDTNHDNLTLSVGGAAVSMTASSAPGSFDLGPAGGLPAGTGGGVTGSAPTPGSGFETPPAMTEVATGGQSGGTAVAAVSSTPDLAGSTTLSLPTPSTSPGGAHTSGPSAGAANSGGTGSPAEAAPASLSLPGGLGLGWWILVIAAALIGAALTTRLPAVLESRAARSCPDENARPRRGR